MKKINLKIYILNKEEKIPYDQLMLMDNVLKKSDKNGRYTVIKDRTGLLEGILNE
jgi:hypothetical protein